MTEAVKRPQTLNEEIANSVTHGIGAALGVAALAVLVSLAALHGDAWRVVSFSIYGASLILLYLASTLYHGFQSPKRKHLFHIFDRTAIYLLIAGTYTPFTLVTLRDNGGWAYFGIIWACALAGIIFTLLFFGRFQVVSVASYVIMGWIVVIAIKPMIAAIPTTGMILLAAGGLSYTGGVIFYAWKSKLYTHTIWHLFVLAGSVLHFLTIYLYVLPMNVA